MKILEPNTSPVYPIFQGESVQEYRQKKRMELWTQVYLESAKGDNTFGESRDYANLVVRDFDKAFPVDVIEGGE